MEQMLNALDKLHSIMVGHRKPIIAPPMLEPVMKTVKIKNVILAQDIATDDVTKYILFPITDTHGNTQTYAISAPHNNK